MATSRPRTKRPAVKARDVMAYLGPEYGPVEWTPRYDGASELVYTILSQHTSDINSERAFKSLMETFGSLGAVAAADTGGIEAAIRSGGLARIKAGRIKEVLNQVHDDVGSFDLSFLAEMPLAEAKAWLRKLPGIGPKTAAIILCFSFGMPAMPVDTHIYRVSQRLRLIGPKVSTDKAHDLLEAQVPPEEVFAFHMYLIRHGRQVCKAQRPQCGRCVLAWGCPSRRAFDRAAARRQKGSTGRAGAGRKRPSS